MARYDFYRQPDGSGFLLDCQADLLRDLSTRLVIPLMPSNMAPRPATRLNPLFDIEGGQYVLVTQFAATIPTRELTDRVGSLGSHDMTIMAALDMLLTGY